VASERSTSEPRRCEREGCPNVLKGRQKRFCSNACRAIYTNMAKGTERRKLAESVALQEIRDKIEPVTRELLTDKVLWELHTLVDLIPAAVSELASELARDEDGNPLVEDADIRHKAAVQLLKWTVGNNSIAPASAEQQPAPLQVIIGTGLSQTTSIDGEAEDDPEDVRECLECHLVKPAKDFVGDSNRCQACHQKLLDSVRERYGADALGSVHASEEPSSA
jgi:hypothetical protein